MMMKNGINNLIKVLKADTNSLLYSLELHLKNKLNYNVISHYPYYVLGQGNIPILLVAHVDTVHKEPPTEIYHDQKQGVLWSPAGLGADDRAGIYAILNLLEKGYRPHILFTNYEESGGIGSHTIIKNYPSIPEIIKDTKYIIQLDRRGVEDCVFYSCDNKDFITYIEEYGFVESTGSFSDISIICPQWGIAGVNLSVGYRNEHTTNEILVLFDLEATINKVEYMLNSPPQKVFEYIEKKYSYTTTYYSSNSRSNTEICYYCYRQFDERELIDVPDYQMLLCPDCYSRIMNTCSKCHKEFYDPTHLNSLCPECQAKKGDEELPWIEQ